MPTREEKLKTIRDACVKANPDIMKLKLGCKCKAKTDTNKYMLTYVGENNGQHALTVKGTGALIFAEEIGVSTEILGRDIRLADVLLVVHGNKEYVDVVIDSRGRFGDDNGALGIHDKGVMWNLLSDSLDEQSDETLTFIWNLIK